METPDYDEVERKHAFVPATQLHLEGSIVLAEPRKAPVKMSAEATVIVLAEHRKKKLRAA